MVGWELLAFVNLPSTFVEKLDITVPVSMHQVSNIVEHSGASLSEHTEKLGMKEHTVCEGPYCQRKAPRRGY